MMLTPKIMKALSLCALGVVLVGCTAAPKRTDSYVSSSGAVTMIENDKESCMHSCNAEFDRCGDTTAAQTQVGRGQLTGVFGAQADCKDDMRACLARCKTR